MADRTDDAGRPQTELCVRPVDVESGTGPGTLLLAGVAAVAGFWLAFGVAARHEVLEGHLADPAVRAPFGLWLTLLGVVGAIAGLQATVGIQGLLRFWASDREVVRRTSVRSAVGIVAVLAVLLLSIRAVGENLEFSSAEMELNRVVAPITVGVLIATIPGLLHVLVLRAVAREQIDRRSSTVHGLERLRRALGRQTGVFGALLTAAVVATGLRRRALLALAESDSDLMIDVPTEQVLLYGLTFAAVLAGFYLAGSSALERQADHLVDRFAPAPDPGEAGSVQRLEERAKVRKAIGRPGGLREFQSLVIVASPLLTALLGAAIG